MAFQHDDEATRKMVFESFPETTTEEYAAQISRELFSDPELARLREGFAELTVGSHPIHILIIFSTYLIYLASVETRNEAGDISRSPERSELMDEGYQISMSILQERGFRVSDVCAVAAGMMGAIQQPRLWQEE